MSRIFCRRIAQRLHWPRPRSSGQTELGQFVFVQQFQQLIGRRRGNFGRFVVRIRSMTSDATDLVERLAAAFGIAAQPKLVGNRQRPRTLYFGQRFAKRRQVIGNRCGDLRALALGSPAKHGGHRRARFYARRISDKPRDPIMIQSHTGAF